MADTTVPPPTTTPPPRPAAPGAVTVVSARPGGGSEEVVVHWDAVADTTGYRVLCAGTADGPFAAMADLDITSGRMTAAANVTTVWSATRNYSRAGSGLAAPDPSPWFESVDVGQGRVGTR